MALYEATDGANWRSNDNWLSEAPLGEWHGVITDRNGRVTGLDLRENQLTGEIPAELGSLSNLEWVYLGWNQLHGTIPPDLGRLTNLELLELIRNRLSGEIPGDLGSLANLQELLLSENQLSGEIPTELGNLTNLLVLELSWNQLSGEIPAELGNLANLESLWLPSNQLSGEIPAELGRLSNLQEMHIWSNQLTGEIPAELGNLTNLGGLELGWNQLSGEIPEELGNLSNLKDLVLVGNRLSGEIPAELGSLASLELLALHDNRLSGEIPAELGNLANLEVLVLLENQLSGCVPDKLRDQLDMDRSHLGGLPFCKGTPTAQLTAAEVYALVSPSVPFVKTPTGTGSGVLIEGGYVVTNYHVVWPYQAVWVVFPDDQVLQNVPVVGWDSMADLAVLGPVDVPARPLGEGGGPLQLGDGEDLAPGSELFLVGYPAEVDEFPEPAITRGILSRIREWERLGMTYLQTDAAIAGGQSGGALVNSLGEVIGISTFSFSEAGFGLATSAADNAPIVERLIQGEFTSGLGDRRLPSGGVAFEFHVELANFWDSRTFVLDATAGTILQAEIDGPEDGLFRVYDPSGLLLEVDGVATGIESGTVELLVDGVHFLQVELFAGESASFDLTSTVGLKPFHDPDDGRTIAVGETVVGNLDFFFDLDWYSIRLEEGETVRISTDSINVDTLLAVDFPNSRDDQVVSDDDSGGGLSGLNSELVYRAPNTGEYFIVVTDAVGDSFGGYYLSVERAPVGTETVHVPTGSQVVERQVVESPFGAMVVFEDPSGYFQVQVPADWAEEKTDSSDGKVFEAHDPEGNGGILIYVEEGVLVSLTEYADALESELLEGQKVITREIVQTAQGLPAAILEYSFDVDGDVVSGTALIYLSDGGKAIFITYVFPAAQFDAGRELAYYSFDTFTATATPMPAPASTDTAYEGLLRTIPDTPELRRQVYINDYALVRQMFDIPLPGPGDDEDALAEFYERRPPTGFEGEADDPPVRGFGAISFFGPFNQYRNITAENLQHLAFDVRSMDQSIVALALPATLDVVRGRFDPQATDKALESCSECEPHSREEYGGVSYYSWGEDYAADPQLRFAPPAFDEIGRGGRIAVLDEYVFRTLGTSNMEALIDAGLNEGASLADVEEFRLLAGGMSRLGAYTMLLSDDVEVWDADGYYVPLLQDDATGKDVVQAQRELSERGPWIRPYEAFATRAGKDENGRYMALVLVHADDASAEENVGLMRRFIEEEGSVLNDALWSDCIDVERSEIHAEGRVLLAKLRGGFANNWLSWVIQRDGLILHE